MFNDVRNNNGEFLQLRDELEALGLLDAWDQSKFQTRTPEASKALQDAIVALWNALAMGPELTREQAVAINLTGYSFSRSGAPTLDEYYRFVSVYIEPGQAFMRESLMKMIEMEQRGCSRQEISNMILEGAKECREIYARADCAMTGKGTGLPVVASPVTTVQVGAGGVGSRKWKTELTKLLVEGKTFDELTPRAASVAIAFEVQKRLGAGKFSVGSSHHITHPFSDFEHHEPFEKLDELLNRDNCTVGVHGAMMIALLGMAGGSAREIVDEEISGDVHRLEDYFHGDQLAQIAMAFEDPRMGDNAETRIVAIMQNIVDNDGTFVPLAAVQEDQVA